MGCCVSCLRQRYMNLYAELMAAIYRGSAADVAAVLRHAPSLANAVSDTMHAPLLFAAACGRGDVVRALLNAGASLDIRDGHGMTSLMVAADAAQPGALRVLLAAAGGTCAARLETRGSVGFMGEDKFSWNALQVAAANQGILSSLVHLFGMLMAMSRDKLTEERRQRAGHPLGRPPDSDADAPEEQRSFECMVALLRAGASQAAVDEGGHLAVHLAAMAKTPGALRALLAANPRVAWAKDPYGCTPLAYAARMSRLPAMRLLAAHAGVALVMARSNSGFLPIHEAAASGGKAAAEAVQLLLAAAPDTLEATGQHGSTPLHAAASTGRPATVATLLAAGASPLALNVRSITPLGLAAELGENAEAVRVLLDAAPEAALLTDDDGDTPLHSAAAGFERGGGHLPTLRALLEACPEAAERRNHARHLPLQVALHQAAAPGAGSEERRKNLAAAGVLARVGPFPLLLQTLAAAGQLAVPLHADLAASRVLTEEQWQQLPMPCPGLGAALPEVLQRSEAEAAFLVARLPAADRARLRTAVLCLECTQRSGLPPLPTPLQWIILALALSVAAC